MESIGSSSRFQKKYGYHIDLMRSEIQAMFPEGWSDRTISVSGLAKTNALEKHDVAIAKLRVGREKDMKALTLLLEKNMLDSEILRERLRMTRMVESEIVATHERFKILLKNNVSHGNIEKLKIQMKIGPKPNSDVNF